MPAGFSHLTREEKRGIAEERFWSGRGSGWTTVRVAEVCSRTLPPRLMR